MQFFAHQHKNCYIFNKLKEKITYLETFAFLGYRQFDGNNVPYFSSGQSICGLAIPIE